MLHYNKLKQFEALPYYFRPCYVGPTTSKILTEVFFQTFDMSISSGDICDQSRKLSEIAPKFGRFLALPNFFGAGLPKVVRALSPLPRITSSGEVS